MPTYDGHLFSPPAPIASVRITNLDTGASLEGVAMLIDSGADMSVLPASAVDTLTIQTSDVAYDVMAYDNSERACRAVEARVTFVGRRFAGRFLVIDQDYGVLGRDILNHVVLVLNGPGLAWEARSPQTGAPN